MANIIERHIKVRREANPYAPPAPSNLSDAATVGGAYYAPAQGLVKSSPLAYKLKMLMLLIAGTPHTGTSLERLEPCEGKLSRTVLRWV